MRIGLAGTMSVGKTTLVNELSKLPEFKNYHIATERSKYLRDLGVPLNTDSTILGQFLFMGERAAELTNENLLSDRTIWDVCAFTLSAKSISFTQRQNLVIAGSAMMEYYDIVFYINPEGTVVENNGVRETDVTYRSKIDYVIKELLKEYPPKKLVEISGSTEDRIRVILSYMK